MRLSNLTLCSCVSLILIAGCEAPAAKLSVAKQIVQLREEKNQLNQQLQSCKTENALSAEQIEILSTIAVDQRLQNIYQTQEIKITRFTNLYDKDEDGLFEKLITYIQPIDQDGDIVKATGYVSIQLWDLNKPDDQAMIGQWDFSAGQLRKLWRSAVVTSYRFECGLDQQLQQLTTPLTVIIVFTDYLTGKTFTEQKIIKPK